MEIRHLRAFLVLAEERHFSRAAARLHIAQPALSQQLKTLEREVGTVLLDRSTRHVDLTEAGRLLQERAARIVAALDRTRADLDLLAAGLAGKVRLGFVGTATYDVLPQAARRLRAELPEVHLDLRGELLGPDLLDSVREGVLDLAVLRTAAAQDGDGLTLHHLREEPLVAVLPAAHPLAGAPAVELAALAGEAFVTHPAGHRSTMQPLVLDACRRAGFEPADVVEVGETGTLVVFVAAGMGVALVPASVRALRLDGVSYVPLTGPPHRTSLVLAERPDAPRVVRRVAEIVRSVTSA
ncbi:LysR substrate-binding domain-containing protein [Streptomyces sp. NPDC093085]|uniref:LysR substrate-binding domain-containing protein n=1 Tax=Streptomyces sp. NPDC093085 TaxID=3155068 RepID=UPI00343D5E7A